MCVKQLTMEERKAMSEEKWSEGGPLIELSAVIIDHTLLCKRLGGDGGRWMG
jgi:hypothetical protein